jgi:hypothetical protein
MNDLQKKDSKSSNIDEPANNVNTLDDTTITCASAIATKKVDDECNELKNITYKNRMLTKNKYDASSNPSNKQQDTHTNILNINMFLEKEQKINKGEPWNKLDKTEKIHQFNNFIDTNVKDTHNLTLNEANELKSYLSTCLDRKKLLCVKDVQYDKTVNKIKLIPCLHFNQTTRKFTLNRSDKRVSTSKSLGQGQTLSVSSTKKEKVKEIN